MPAQRTAAYQASVPQHASSAYCSMPAQHTAAYQASAPQHASSAYRSACPLRRWVTRYVGAIGAPPTLPCTPHGRVVGSGCRVVGRSGPFARSSSFGRTRPVVPGRHLLWAPPPAPPHASARGSTLQGRQPQLPLPLPLPLPLLLAVLLPLALALAWDEVPLYRLVVPHEKG